MQFGATWNHLWLYAAIWRPQRLIAAVWAAWCHMGLYHVVLLPSGATLGQLVPSGAIWGAVCGYMKQSGATMCHLGPSGAIWCILVYLGLPGTIWVTGDVAYTNKLRM